MTRGAAKSLTAFLVIVNQDAGATFSRLPAEERHQAHQALLRQVSPLIQANDGWVEDFSGLSLQARFDQGTEKAMAAAEAVHQYLKLKPSHPYGMANLTLFLAEEGPIDTWPLITRGSVLATEGILQSLESSSLPLYRWIGREITAQGQSREVFELLLHQDDPQRNAKQAHAPVLQEVGRAFLKGDMQRAIEELSCYLDAVPTDPVGLAYQAWLRERL